MTLLQTRVWRVLISFGGGYCVAAVAVFGCGVILPLAGVSRSEAVTFGLLISSLVYVLFFLWTCTTRHISAAIVVSLVSMTVVVGFVVNWGATP